MRRYSTKKKGSNRGFSLIEVLCAIVLLGLIAAPFIQMIYSSYATNLKSKKYLAAADLCQTVMEGISGQTYEDSVTIGTTTESIQGLGNYYFPATGGTGEKGLFGSPKTNANLILKGNCNGASSGAFSGSTPKKAFFNNVKYGGYQFNVVITAHEEDSYPSTQKYFTVKMEIDVYDVITETSTENTAGDSGVFTDSNLSSFKKLQTASTKIQNKR